MTDESRSVRGATQEVQDEPRQPGPEPGYGHTYASRPSLDGYGYGYGYGGSGGDQGGELFDLRSLIGILRRRKYMIAGITLLATIVAALYVNQLTPLYRAHSQIIVEPNRQNVVDIEKVTEAPPTDWMTTRTEAAVIGSREMAKRAVERLGLPSRSRPAARPQQAKPGVSDRLRSSVATLMDEWGLPGSSLVAPPQAPSPKAPPRPVDPEERLERLTSSYLSGLDAFPSENSRVITVRYVSTDPVFAARAANAAAAVYIESQEETKGRATTQATAWLAERVKQVQDRLVESERRLEEFRRASGLRNVDGSTLPAQQLSRLNAELIEARTRLAEARARYNQVQSLVERPGEIETTAAVLGNSLIQRLREQEIELNRKIAELATQYRENHPKMVLARAELADMRDRIDQEIDKIALNLKNEVDVAQVRVDNLEREVAKLREELDGLNAAEVELRTLESEVGANRELYNTLLERLKETDIQQDKALQRPDAKVISRATVPGSPFYPRKRTIVAVALFAGLVFSIGLAVVLEMLDSGFRSLSQIESEFGMPTLGMVPMLKLRKHEEPYVHAVETNGSVYAESIRTLRTALSLSNMDTPPTTVMVTSSEPSEGKTSTVLAVASQAVGSGKTCIVVDCDLRASNVAGALGYSDRIGLADFLAGEASIEEVLEIDPRTGVHFIGGGSRTSHPVELLGSEAMRQLLDSLAEVYDMVLVDTPPILAVSDALVLMREVDATVFLVRWEKTDRKTAKVGLKLALEAHAVIAGVALTYVDVRRHAQYDYADSGYYYHKTYQKYYAGS